MDWWRVARIAGFIVGIAIGIMLGIAFPILVGGQQPAGVITGVWVAPEQYEVTWYVSNSDALACIRKSSIYHPETPFGCTSPFRFGRGGDYTAYPHVGDVITVRVGGVDVASVTIPIPPARTYLPTVTR